MDSSSPPSSLYEEKGKEEEEGRSLIHKGEIFDNSPLSKIEKLGYGIGDSGTYTFNVISGFFLNSFLLEVAGLSPLEAGILLFVGQFWNGLTDPIVGRMSDNTRTKWGRRRPWLFLGAFPFALFYFCMWLVPPVSQFLKILYYGLILLLVNTACTCVNVPYVSLTPELTSSYHLRTELTLYRMAFCMTFGIIGGFVHSSLIELFHTSSKDKSETYEWGYLLSGAIFAAFIPIPSLITSLLVRERVTYTSPPERASLVQSVIQIWREMVSCLDNKQFISVMLTYLFSWLSVNLVQSNLILYAKYVIKKEDHFKFMITAVQVSAAVSLFFWAWASKKIGKKPTYYVGMGIMVTCLVVLAFATPDWPIGLIYTMSIISGNGVSISFLIPWSMIPDVVDLDRLVTGKAREGLFYSMFVVFQKIGVASALAASGVILSAAGYEAPDSESEKEREEYHQPKSAIIALRIMVGFLPACLISLSFISLFFYKINGKEHARILAELEAKREAGEGEYNEER